MFSLLALPLPSPGRLVSSLSSGCPTASQGQCLSPLKLASSVVSPDSVTTLLLRRLHLQNCKSLQIPMLRDAPNLIHVQILRTSLPALPPLMLMPRFGHPGLRAWVSFLPPSSNPSTQSDRPETKFRPSLMMSLSCLNFSKGSREPLAEVQRPKLAPASLR